MKKVLEVGNCGPDRAAIRSLIESCFEAHVDSADAADDALAAMRSGGYSLVLVNRKLDIDYSDGVEVIRAIKTDPKLADVPVMLVTNFEEHQQQAMEIGAERGFGKLELDTEQTQQRLAKFLAPGA